MVLCKRYEENQIANSKKGGLVKETQPFDLVDQSLKSRVFTVDELEQIMVQASAQMEEIQKQLHRGEEVYFEETQAHGNLYRGWDTFIDLKDVGINPGGGVVPQPGASRRMPSDNRWFSGSCRSVARAGRPLSRMSMTPTPSISRSNTATPVSSVASPSRMSENGTGIASVTNQQESTKSAKANPPPESDAVPSSMSSLTDTIKTPKGIRSDVEHYKEDHKREVDKSDSNDVTPIEKTPLRRNSSRKRKQGDS